MKEIAFTRIDDRLIHGQVVTNWLKYTNANKIIIADDKIPNDRLMQRVLTAAAPPNTVVKCLTVDQTVEYLNGEPKPNERIFILAKGPEVYERMIDKGISIPRLNLAGMVNKAGREQLIKNVHATPEEKDCFRRIVAKGTKVFFQRLVNDPEEDVEPLLK